MKKGLVKSGNLKTGAEVTLFQNVHSFLTFSIPVETCVFSGELMKGLSMACIVQDETVIVSRQSEELPDLFQDGWGFLNSKTALILSISGFMQEGVMC